MLSKFVDEKQGLGFLPTAPYDGVSFLCAESTGFSPNEMMCGREVLLPLDLGIGQTEPTGNSMTEYTAKLSDQMEQIHQFACQHSKLSSDHQKKNYNHHPVNQHQYDWGDAVWLYSPRKKKGIYPKLIRHCDSPYSVVKRMSDVLYRIQKGLSQSPKLCTMTV